MHPHMANKPICLCMSNQDNEALLISDSINFINVGHDSDCGGGSPRGRRAGRRIEGWKQGGWMGGERKKESERK